MDISKHAAKLLHQLQTEGSVDNDELQSFLVKAANGESVSHSAVSYERAFQTSSTFQFVVDDESIVLNSNNNAKQFFGNSTVGQNLCSAMSCSVAVHDEEQPVCQKCIVNNIKQALELREYDLLPLKEPFFLIQENGKNILFNIYSSFFTTDGQKQAVISLEDVSFERQKLDEQEKRNRIVFETERLANFGRWELDRKKKQFKLSEESLSIFELQKDTVSLDEFIALLHPEDVQNVKKFISRNVEECSGKPIEFRVLSPNNKIKHVIVRGEMFLDKDTGEKRFWGFVQDISHYKKTLRILSARERKLRHISEISSDYTYSILLKKGYFFEWISGAFTDITGYTIKEISEMPLRWMSVVHPNDLEFFVEKLKNASYENKSTAIEYRIVTKSGEVKWIRDVYRYICEEVEGGQNRLIGSVRDITHRKNVELDLLEAKEVAEKSDRLKTAFLNNLSHEVRTPLNSIIGFARFMRDRDVDEHKRKLYANALIDSSNRLLKIILDIVYVSKLETGFVKTRTEKVKLHQLLFNLVSLHKEEAEQKGLALEFECAEFGKDEVYFQSDSAKLMQVLENLVLNAIKFTSEGFVKVYYEISEDKLMISVEDSGIGIKAEDYELIFQRFSQVDSGISRKYGGNGLGLSIAQSIARLLGGELLVESEPEVGSCFTLSFPYKPVRQELCD